MTLERLKQAEMHRDRGAAAAARLACEEILRDDPGNAAAMNLMAALAADERDFAAGLRWAERAAAADPASAAPHYTLGRLFQAEGRLAEAEASYRRSLALAEMQPRAHNNLGCVLQMQGRLEPALASFRRALELDPSLPEARQNVASLTREPEILAAAAAGFLDQVKANPADVDAWNNLGNVYRELGRHREAIASFAETIARDPQHAEAHFSRSFVRLLTGDYIEGWKDFEWRWRVKGLNTPMRPFAQPLWDGRDLGGGTLLLHAEQGLGDTLQFVRYAALAARRCRELLLECQPELVSLMRSVPGVSRVLAQGEPLPAFHAHLPLMSAPAVFGTTLQSIPWSGPYVRSDPARTAQWRARIAEGAVLDVGLAWAGRPQQWDDRKRSITLEMLAPLARAAGVSFYSLQKGPAAAQAAAPPPGMRLRDLTPQIADFADTAALMSCLDLVISIDTSVTHLAGAMGVPAWTLVAHAPDWRYHLERADNPWYPTMRLYRQEADGEWQGAIERAAASLAALAQARATSKPFK